MVHKVFDLRKQLLFYKRYHHQPVNVWIHTVFVPTILFSSSCMLSKVKIHSSGWTLAHAVAVMYSVYYTSLHVQAGLLATALFAALSWWLDHHDTALQTDAILFTTGWICQFIGHGVFEHKRPAVVDNLLQSLVLAPYFIMFELLFKLGYYRTLQAQLQADLQATT